MGDSYDCDYMITSLGIRNFFSVRNVTFPQSFSRRHPFSIAENGKFQRALINLRNIDVIKIEQAKDDPKQCLYSFYKDSGTGLNEFAQVHAKCPRKI